MKIKKYALALICLPALTFISNANGTSTKSATIENSPFQGTWQLVSGEYINDKGTLINYESLSLTSQKVLSDQHFSFISLSNGKFWAAGSGSYQFDNHSYIEFLSLAAVDAGKPYQFNYKIVDGTWTNERWVDGKRVEMEVWKKID